MVAIKILLHYNHLYYFDFIESSKIVNNKESNFCSTLQITYYTKPVYSSIEKKKKFNIMKYSTKAIFHYNQM